VETAETVSVAVDQAFELDPGQAQGSRAILPSGRNLTYPTQRLFARLYQEGMSSGDFEPAFRELDVGIRFPSSRQVSVSRGAVIDPFSPS
jgi:hypothetical protein